MKSINRNNSLKCISYDDDKLLIKREIKKYSGNYCMICGREYKNNPISDKQKELAFSIEHVKPKAQYAKLRDEYTNMIGLCTQCNNKRDNNIEVLSPTDIERYNEHIIFNKYTGELLAKKESKYFLQVSDTINAYKLNREELNQLRKNMANVLSASGLENVKADLLNYSAIYSIPHIVILKELELSGDDEYDKYIDLIKDLDFTDEVIREEEHG